MPIPLRVAVHIMHADAIVSAGLHAVLSATDGFDVSLHAGDNAAALAADVLIADYHNGIDFCKCLARAPNPHALRVLIVTQFGKEWEVLNAMEYGAHGYLLQSSLPEELTRAVRSLKLGVRYMGDAVARSVASSLQRIGLTGRETDVLQLLAKGHCNKLIARELGIGVATVKAHVKNVVTKLDATARTHAVVVATQRGLINSEINQGGGMPMPRQDIRRNTEIFLPCFHRQPA